MAGSEEGDVGDVKCGAAEVGVNWRIYPRPATEDLGRPSPGEAREAVPAAGLWRCSISCCTASRTAPPAAHVGVLADGWTVSASYGLRCPAHRVDLIDCGDCGATRDRVAMDIAPASDRWRRHPDGSWRCAAHGYQVAQASEAAGEEEEEEGGGEPKPKFYWAVQPAAVWQTVVARTQAEDAARDHAARLAAVEELAAEAAGQRQVADMDRRLEQLEARDANLHVSRAALSAALSDAVQRLTAVEGRIEAVEDTTEILHGLGSLGDRADRCDRRLTAVEGEAAEALQRVEAQESRWARLHGALARERAARLRQRVQLTAAHWGGWGLAAGLGAGWLLHSWGWM